MAYFLGKIKGIVAEERHPVEVMTWVTLWQQAKQRSGFERIDMSRLPAGTYTWRVMMEDGKIYSDKVVKE